MTAKQFLQDNDGLFSSYRLITIFGVVVMSAVLLYATLVGEWDVIVAIYGIYATAITGSYAFGKGFDSAVEKREIKDESYVDSIETDTK